MPVRRFEITGAAALTSGNLLTAVSIEVSIQGTFLGPFETPAGVIWPTGAKLDIPCGDFWYVRDGKIQAVKEYLDTMHANDVLCS